MDDDDRRKQSVINILRNDFRKDEKIRRRYEKDGNTVAAYEVQCRNNMLASAINLLEAELYPRPYLDETLLTDKELADKLLEIESEKEYLDIIERRVENELWKRKNF